MFVSFLKTLLAVWTVNAERWVDQLIINWMGYGMKSDLKPCPGRSEENYEFLQNVRSVGEDLKSGFSEHEEELPIRSL